MIKHTRRYIFIVSFYNEEIYYIMAFLHLKKALNNSNQLYHTTVDVFPRTAAVTVVTAAGQKAGLYQCAC